MYSYLICFVCLLLDANKVKRVEQEAIGVGLGRVVRKVRQHPDDHEFESQRWQ
jgi:hypothetical protein